MGANGLAFCALIHNFFPQSFDFKSLKTDTAADRRRNFDLAFTTGEKFAGVPDFLTAEDMSGMVEESRVDPKMIFSYVQEVYRMSTSCRKWSLANTLTGRQDMMKKVR